MLILDDWLPICDHDPAVIAQQLRAAVLQWNCSGVLLDFQRQGMDQTAMLCDRLVKTLPCPVGVSEFYGKELSCPVFLSPPELLVPLNEHIAPWRGREIWLELALDAQKAVISETECQMFSCPLEELPQPWHKDPGLHCRYHWSMEQDTVQFLLCRTKEDAVALLQNASGLGVSCGVGLYQQLK